jgi:hypothetical protein
MIIVYKTELQRLWRKWEDNIERDLRETGRVYVNKLRNESLMAVFCEHADESSRAKCVLKDDSLPRGFSHQAYHCCYCCALAIRGNKVA